MQVPIFDEPIQLDASLINASTAEIRAQVTEYERGARHRFALDISMPDGLLGRVMEAMRSIPYGETSSYGAIAASLDTAPLAVGNACARNPVPLIVPCHRVVRSDGGLGGYSAADGVATKRRLLTFEARNQTLGSMQTTLATDR